jgi:hypothetical protein
MIYLEINDRSGEIQVYLEGTYSLRDLIDIIAENADSESDTEDTSIDSDTDLGEGSEDEDNSLIGRLIKLG